VTSQRVDQLLRENEELRHRLEEAEETVRALRGGEVDAVFVESGSGHIYTLESTDRPYRLLVEQMPHGAATLTVEGTIIYGNRRFTELLGLPLASLIGRPITDFVAENSSSALNALLQDGQAAEVEGDVTLARASGETVPVYLGVSAVEEGVRGLCLMVTDLTEQRNYQELKRTQDALRASEERFNLAQEAGCIGTFEWNIASGEVNWSTINEEIYGLRAGGFGGRYEHWKQMVHPDDRDRADQDRRRAVAERTALDSEFRIIRPDGKVCWIATKGKVFCDSEGKPWRMLGVSMDITERKHAEEALLNADRRKDEFLATLAHELRNPLAPIRNAIEILKATSVSPHELEWSWGVLDRQVQLMGRLLEDLLDVSRISLNKLELRRERVELADVLQSALETSRPVIEARGHELGITLLSGPIYLDADPVRLAQVFANIFNNAAKYTEEGGRIDLKAERLGDDVAVSVTDNGVGIRAELLPRIFEIFAQSSLAHLQSPDGIGIGLSLAKGLVEMHGGSIEAHSDGPGKGSAFVVRLPLAGETPVAVPVPPAENHQQPIATKARILIVDDYRDSADSLAMLLKTIGYEVETAYNGEEAVHKAALFRPRMVLLDIGMPVLNGYGACRRIREQPWGKDMFLIALTGWGQEDDRRRTEAAGFDLHLIKPVSAAAIIELLASLSSTEPEDESMRD
jgi:PAS domain S-box-containing protein